MFHLIFHSSSSSFLLPFVFLITTTYSSFSPSSVHANLKIIHYTQFADCTGPAVSNTYSLDSCIFGAGGKTSSLYQCNNSHATSMVYTSTSDCTLDPLKGSKSMMTTEATLDECHRVISTSIRFVCSNAEKVGGLHAVMSVLVGVLMLMMIY